MKISLIERPKESMREEFVSLCSKELLSIASFHQIV